jgi:hypothetical protein
MQSLRSSIDNGFSIAPEIGEQRRRPDRSQNHQFETPHQEDAAQYEFGAALGMFLCVGQRKR